MTEKSIEPNSDASEPEAGGVDPISPELAKQLTALSEGSFAVSKACLDLIRETSTALLEATHEQQRSQTEALEKVAALCRSLADD